MSDCGHNDPITICGTCQQTEEANQTHYWLGECLKRDKRIADLEHQLAEACSAKDAAYTERDRLVCALSKAFPSFLGRHSPDDVAWDDDWRWIVFVELPTGQASWHIHDSEREWFNHLAVRTGSALWDGHTTEEKYRRLDALTVADARGAGLRELAAALRTAQSHIRYAMANSTVTTSDDPGCFWCDTAGHHAGCSVVELNSEIDRLLAEQAKEPQ